MKTKCPKCRQSYEVEEAMTGQAVECEFCNKIFTVEKSVQTPTKTKKTIPKNKPLVKFEYKTPILATIFQWVGIFSIIACVIFFVIAVTLTTGEKPQAIAGIVGSFINILVCFGMSQLIEFIAKTAHFTEKISKQMDQK